MFAWMKNRNSVQRNAQQLYESIVQQARQPGFYREIGVADTLEGRFEMVVLHLFIVLERLTAARPQSDNLARVLTEHFVTDMDDCMRELGVGDTAVPKKVKRAALALRERSSEYKQALETGEPRLAETLRASSGGLEGELLSEDAASRLGAYVVACRSNLAGQDFAGNTLPDPAFADIRAF